MSQTYFKTGEFAKLCGTTKDTLFHYDDIGLLKPAKVAPNGYRYYAVNQAYLFDMISLLKEVGMNLSEIKNYMDRRDTNTFLHMLKEKDKKMREEIERLKRLRHLLKNTINITQTAFDVETDKISFVDKQEEYFIVTPGEIKRTEKLICEAIFNHVDYCTKRNYAYTFMIGEIISRENIADKSFRTSYYSTRVDRKVKDKQLYIKPAGKYAVKYICGSYNDLMTEYALFIDELNESGYSINGDIYEEDLLNYLSETDFNDFLMKIEVRVE